MLSKEEIKKLRKEIKSGKYNWELAILHSAERIVEHPEVLLWR